MSSVLQNHLQKHYSVGEITTLRPIHGGEENRNFIVTAGDDKYVLRVYSTHHSTTGPRKPLEIEFELDFIEAAQENGVPTPPVVRPLTGARVTTITLEGQPHFAALFGYAQGSAPEIYTQEIASASAGSLLALRQTSRAFRVPCPRPWPGDIVRLSLDFYAAHHGAIASHTGILDRLHRVVTEGFAQALAASLPTGVIHGAIKLGNLLFQGSRLSAVIDFDDYRETFLLEEFTRTVMHDLDSPTRNVIRAGFYPVFHDALAADPTVTAVEIAHLRTFLQARLIYDLAAYCIAGLSGLVDDVLSDANVQAVLLSDL